MLKPYWNATRAPRYSVIIALPLFVAYEGNTQVAQLIDQLLGAVRSRMPAGPAVHGDQTTYPGVEPLEGPLALGHIVVHHAADLGDAVHHPARLAERRDEEPYAVLDRHVHPARHALEVQPGGLLDQHVHADRFRGEPANQLKSLPQLMSVHEHHRQGLDDPDAAGFGHGGDELRVGAWEHGAADERHGDTRVPGEGGVEPARGHGAGAGPMRQRTVARATTSPAASLITDSKSCSASRLESGMSQRASAVRVPRAFFR